MWQHPCHDQGRVASICEICNNHGKKQSWIETDKEIIFITKNVKKIIENRMTPTDRLADSITAFCGNMTFVYVHLVWFMAWLVYNSIADKPFDPYPFGMLTLIVSLEAIILATFILISQNRQGEISELRSESDYRVDLKAEKKITEVLTLIQEIHANLVSGKQVKNKKRK